MSGSDDSVIAIVLAAGEGRRLGGNKGLVELAGRPALARLLDEIEGAPVQSAIVVTGAEHESLAPLVRTGGAREVHNASWRDGMLGSIKAGLAALPGTCGAFLVHPVDFVFTTRADLEVIVTAWRDLPDRDRAIVRPHHGDDYGHPVLFARRYAAEFLGLRDDEAGHAVYRRHRDRVFAVPVDNPHIRFDLDTPEDLLRAATILGDRA